VYTVPAYMKLNYECLRNCVWCGPQQAFSNALTARRYGQNVQVGNIPYLFIQLTCKGHLPDVCRISGFFEDHLSLTDRCVIRVADPHSFLPDPDLAL
jgi:hypothetical protein